MPSYTAPPFVLMPAEIGPGSAVTGASIGRLTDVLVWATMAASSLVLIEPAPFEAMVLLLISVLLMGGTAALGPRHLPLLISWAVIGVAGIAATAQARAFEESLLHMLVSMYLSVAAMAFAAYIAWDPGRRVRIVMSGYVAAAVIASVAAIIGYFDTIPGSHELFTKYGRSSGTFKDPNVLGAFLVPAIIHLVSSIISGRSRSSTGASLLIVPLVLALLLSFSRGAWISLVVASASYAAVGFITAETSRQRVRLVSFSLLGVAAITAIVLAALSIEQVSSLMEHRAELVHSYDNRRATGQIVALESLIDHPEGLGAMSFFRQFHEEQVHNVYISMFLNAGWVGGSLYAFIVLATLAAGARGILGRFREAPEVLPVYCAFLALALEGLIVDTDHWRHFYILMGVLWGVMGTWSRPPERAAQVSGMVIRDQRLVWRCGRRAHKTSQARLLLNRNA